MIEVSLLQLLDEKTTGKIDYEYGIRNKRLLEDSGLIHNLHIKLAMCIHFVYAVLSFVEY